MPLASNDRDDARVRTFITLCLLKTPKAAKSLELWYSRDRTQVSRRRRSSAVPLDSAAVRFVEATDGRGEGLSGIYIVPAEHARLNPGAVRCRY